MRRPVKAQFSVVRSKSTGSRIFQQNSCIYYKFNSWWKKLSLFNPLIHKVCFLVQLPMHAAWRWQQQQQQRYNYDYFNTESSLNFNVQSGLQYLTWRLHQLPFIGSPLPLSFITEQTYGIKDFELGLCDRAIGDGDKTQTLASRICRLHARHAQDQCPVCPRGRGPLGYFSSSAVWWWWRWWTPPCPQLSTGQVFWFGNSWSCSFYSK